MQLKSPVPTIAPCAVRRRTLADLHRASDCDWNVTITSGVSILSRRAPVTGEACGSTRRIRIMSGRGRMAVGAPRETKVSIQGLSARLWYCQNPSKATLSTSLSPSSDRFWLNRSRRIEQSAFWNFGSCSHCFPSARRLGRTGVLLSSPQI